MGGGRIKGPSAVEKVFESDDLLMDLLVRVPARDVLRLRAVNKRWKSLISNPDFQFLHSQSKNLETSLIIGLTNSKFASFNLKTEHFRTLRYEFPTVIVHQTCHGLMLLESFDSDYAIYNPTTGKSRVLPIPHRKASLRGLFLAYEPSKSLYYQLVGVWYENSDYWIRIFHSETGVWVDLNHKLRFATMALSSWNGVYCNNAVYWINFYPDPSYYLDLITQKFERSDTLTIPENLLFGHILIMGANGRLNLTNTLHCRGEAENITVHELVKLEDGNFEWMKKYSFHRSIIGVGYSSFLMWRFGGESENEWRFFCIKEKKIFCVKLSNGEVDVVGIVPDELVVIGGRLHVLETLAPV